MLPFLTVTKGTEPLLLASATPGFRRVRRREAQNSWMWLPRRLGKLRGPIMALTSRSAIQYVVETIITAIIDA
jgi:hypothetical protein